MKNQVERQIVEVEKKRDTLFGEVQNVRARVDSEGGQMSDGLAERLENLNTGIEKCDAELSELRERAGRYETLERLSERPENFERGFEGPEGHTRLAGPHGQVRDAALRTIERQKVDAPIGDRLTSIVARDRSGLDSRYIAAVGTEAYASAFGKRIADPQNAHLSFTTAEAEAVRDVAQIVAERAMSEGVPSAGGFAVPFALDPSIILTSDGALNPWRQLATVTPITTKEWRGIASEGVTASFDEEAEEVSDDAPTLAQPSVKAQRGTAFVPFSIEVGQDYPGFSVELGNVLADAKDNLEAIKFVNGAGDGSNEPLGLISGLSSGSWVETASAHVFVIDDTYGLQEALPPRFQPRAQWGSSLPIANTIARFAGPGSDEPPLFNEDRSRLLGKGWNEVSEMDSAVADGALILVYGDFKTAFRIVDRIGMNVELVQHLMGPNRRPTGERGLFAYWRVGSAPIVPNAVRLLRVDPS